MLKKTNTVLKKVLMNDITCGVFVSGYQIFRAHKLSQDGKTAQVGAFAYVLIGPQDQKYYLMRASDRSKMMVAFDKEQRVIASAFKGVCFIEDGTEIKIVEK